MVILKEIEETELRYIPPPPIYDNPTNLVFKNIRLQFILGQLWRNIRALQEGLNLQ